jgi:hypothetical protein
MVEALAMCLCPKNCVSFEKTLFVKGVAQFGGEDKTRICFVKTCKMLFCHNKFGLIDVKKSI